VQCQHRLRRLARSPQTLTHTQPPQGPYAWYGVSAIGNAFTPAPDADANNGQGTSVLFPIAAISPLTLVAAALLRTGTSHSGSNNEPQDFYAAQELEAHFLNDSGPTASRISTVHVAPARRREPSTIGLYGVISHSGGGFRTFKPLEKLHSHPRHGASASSDSDRIERPASTPPILTDNDMASIGAHVEASAGVRKWEYDQLAWGYRDETGGGGSGGEGVSDDDVALIADERKRARFGNGGIARRRNFGDDKRRPWSAVRAFCFLS